MPANTTTYSFQKPTVGGDEDAWGGYLNGNWDKTDDLLDGTTPVTGIDINSGTIDNAIIGGSTAAAGTFTTLVGTTTTVTTLNVTTGLAANLSTNGFDIVTTSNADLDLAPNGTGKVVVKGNTNSAKLVLNCEVNTHGVTLASPPHSAGATYEVALPNTLGTSNNSSIITSDANGDVNLAAELKATSYNETYVALTAGSSVTVDCETGNVFALTTNQNTTFVFSNPPASGTAFGFVLKLTAGGSHSITWPSSVDWAGGTAPDAPGSGETDVLVFFSYDGGTTWYGNLAIDAAA
tara:strand:- start:11404 stop:12282 length:879 start_codon:yes stop_codon:yes gene_type:complete